MIKNSVKELKENHLKVSTGNNKLILIGAMMMIKHEFENFYFHKTIGVKSKKKFYKIGF
jgi:hypothetical protein